MHRIVGLGTNVPECLEFRDGLYNACPNHHFQRILDVEPECVGAIGEISHDAQIIEGDRSPIQTVIAQCQSKRGDQVWLGFCSDAFTVDLHRRLGDGLRAIVRICGASNFEKVQQFEGSDLISTVRRALVRHRGKQGDECLGNYQYHRLCRIGRHDYAGNRFLQPLPLEHRVVARRVEHVIRVGEHHRVPITRGELRPDFSLYAGRSSHGLPFI